MISTRTISFAPASVIIDTLIPDADEQDGLWNYMDHWSWGDTMHTLVGNNEFYVALREFAIANDIDTSDFHERYWSLIDVETYIDLEN